VWRKFIHKIKFIRYKVIISGGDAYFCGIATPLVMEDFLAKVKVNKCFSMPIWLAKG